MNQNECGAIYARLSKRDAGDISPERQIEKVLAEYQKRGIACRAEKTLQLLRHYRDHPPRAINQILHEQAPDEDVFVEDLGAHSGRSLKQRPEFKRLMRVIETKRYHYVGVDDSTRTARNADDFFMFMRLLQEHGAQYIDVGNPQLNMDSAMGIFIARITAALAELFSNKLSEDQKKNIAHWRKQGGVWGKPPQGLVATGRGKDRRFVASPHGYWLVTLSSGSRIPVVGEQSAPPFADAQAHESQVITPNVNRAESVMTCEWRTYFDLVQAWLTLYVNSEERGRAAARRLNAEGWYARDQEGLPKRIRFYDLRRIINQLDSYRGVIPDDLFQRVAVIRERARKYHLRHREHPRQLLSRLLYCATCGRHYITLTRHDGVVCYDHRSDVCPDAFQVAVHHIDALFWQELAPRMELSPEQQHQIAARTEHTPTPAEQDARRQIIEEQLKRIGRLYRDLIISEDEYTRESAPLIRQLNVLVDTEIETALTAAMPLDQAFERLEKIFSTLRATWELDSESANTVLCDVFQRIYLRSTPLPYHPYHEKYGRLRVQTTKLRPRRAWSIVGVRAQAWARPMFTDIEFSDIMPSRTNTPEIAPTRNGKK